jgi:hypothetical protein
MKTAALDLPNLRQVPLIVEGVHRRVNPSHLIVYCVYISNILVLLLFQL